MPVTKYESAASGLPRKLRTIVVLPGTRNAGRASLGAYAGTATSGSASSTRFHLPNRLTNVLHFA
jgi:hypothetical protein